MGNLFPILRRMERGRKEKASEKISSQNKRKKQNHSSSTTGGCHCLQEQKDISVTQKNTLPSPSLSKRLKASLHSAICFSVSSCTILHYFSFSFFFFFFFCSFFSVSVSLWLGCRLTGKSSQHKPKTLFTKYKTATITKCHENTEEKKQVRATQSVSGDKESRGFGQDEWIPLPQTERTSGSSSSGRKHYGKRWKNKKLLPTTTTTSSRFLGLF